MKTFRAIGIGLLAILVSVNFTACSDDDDDPSTDPPAPEKALVNPANVYPHGIPKSVGDMQITSDLQGRVSKIVDEGTTVTFSYDIAPTRAAVTEPESYDVMMSVEYNSYIHTFYIKLNKSGFMTFYKQVEGGDDESEQEASDKRFGRCEYNADGQLSKLQRAFEGDDYTITYKNGDIVKVQNVDGGNISNTLIEYGDTLIENKGGLMLYDETFGIDMDEVKYVYFAGMLGKATKHLPTKMVEEEKHVQYIYTYDWKLNTQGLPTQLCISESDKVLNFSW